MRYISIFSGIEAATVAWEPLGWEPVAFCEIDAFPSAVLAARFPNVPNLGDITKVDWSPYRGAVDLVVGGSPCQSFSVAGGRESLDGESRLMFEYIRACDEIRSPWIVWENVPGVLNTRDDAFAQLLDSLQDVGYLDLAWRVLDAQFFGVAQRRRRVFLVGHLGTPRACEVLFEPEGVLGDHTSSREKRKALARAAGRGATSGGGEGSCLTPWDAQAKRVYEDDACGPTLSSGTTEGMNIQPTVLQSAGFKFHQGSGAGNIGFEGEQSPTLTTDWHQPAVIASCDRSMAFVQNQQDVVRYFGGDGQTVGAIPSQAGIKQATFVMATLQANTEIGTDGLAPTLTAKAIKEPPTLIAEVDDDE